LTVAEQIRGRVLAAIARNRTPGFHFPGHFLDIGWDVTTGTEAALRLPDGPHIRGGDGCIDITALGVFVDGALGTAARIRDGYHGRLATVSLHLQMTGAAVRGDLSCRSRLLGRMQGTQGQYVLTEATVDANGTPVCHASAKFARLDSPSRSLAPLPWQRAPQQVPPVDEATLNDEERGVLRKCDEALARATGTAAFIRWFWGGEGALDDPSGAGEVLIGPHVGNRVGHGQGGILLGLALRRAGTTIARDWRLSNVTAWFSRPAMPGCITVHSVPVHSGRSTALVSTRVDSPDGAVVLTAVSQHVAQQ